MSGAGELFFVDTNVLLYAVSLAEGTKEERARDWTNTLWETGRGRVSWQVVNEFYANSARKTRLTVPEAQAGVKLLANWCPVDTSLGLIQQAWRLMERWQLAYWDALIVAAAERAGCRWLLTEDLQAGQELGDVTVVNPFVVRPEELGLRSETGRQLKNRDPFRGRGG